MELFFIWLSIVVLFFLIELLGVSYFFFLSFSLGALATALLSLYTQNLAYNFLCFLSASAIFFVLLRVIFNPRRYYSKISPTNVDRLIGMQGIVVKTIAPGISGQVKIDGTVWSARVEMSTVIVEGKLIKVVKIQGCHVIVRPIDTNKE